MSNHTPGPWMFVGNVDHKHVQKTQLIIQDRVRNSKNIASVIPCLGMTGQEIKANAERIVTCVNAMEGIEDPKKLRETWDAIKHLELDAYEKTNQLLTEALLELERVKQQNTLLKEQIDLFETMALLGMKRIGSLDKLEGGVK